MRKIIQIAAAHNGTDALCDDGTVWSYSSEAQQGWLQLPPIPQPNNLAPELDEAQIQAGMDLIDHFVLKRIPAGPVMQPQRLEILPSPRFYRFKKQPKGE